ncbi:L-ascorbate oxidase [Morella rubra]|uniref:L-ascorbate oxidase n=1 Tax=Morella rubra TaxID=262757 RepID=A0A6A1USP9_9ROSI|nr:L-ascorbate oxidase [Morella rubra]KAB1216881.1 L-ascorbate oxidase [Morella rubra]
MVETPRCGRFFVGLLAFSLVTVLNSAEAKTHFHKWELKYAFKSPDCYKKLAVTINGDSPGPTIYAQQGDTIVVEVNNTLVTENVAIHWHGIRQRGTPWSDGTEGVIQCPIMPGDTFIYTFIVDKAGTYLYHAHYGMQLTAGLYGFIIVSVPDGVSQPFAYNYDETIMLKDWYHNSTYEQATGLSSIPFGWVGEPQSLLINGRGRFNCSLVDSGLCNATNPECSPYSLSVVAGLTYRLRIGSLASLSALSFEIENHSMTVVEADGNYVEPFETKNLYINSGETYSVLVTANQEATRNYWITTNVVGRKPSTPTGLAIWNYFPVPHDLTPPTDPTTGPLWNDTASQLSQSRALKAHHDYVQTPPDSERLIVLLNTQNLIDGRNRWSLNNRSLTFPATPYLIALKEGFTDAFDQNPPPDSYDREHYDIYSVAEYVSANASNAIYRIGFNTTVDIVLQNANTMTKDTSETHPWHMHGQDFWVLGFGDGKFNPLNDTENFNFADPIMKNTVPLYPYGWTALRFRADNPGVWIFHCHIEPHLFLGMGIVFEAGVEKVGELPKSIMGCGETKRLINP